MNDALRAAIEPVILALLDEQPDHGYSLLGRIKARTGTDLSDGSLYPALARLEAAGKIEGSWSSTGAGGRRRKIFCLSKKGRGQLNRMRSQWMPFVHAMNKLFGVEGA